MYQYFNTSTLVHHVNVPNIARNASSAFLGRLLPIKEDIKEYIIMSTITGHKHRKNMSTIKNT